MDKIEREMFDVLEGYKLNSDWLQKKRFSKKEIISEKLLGENILFVTEGVMHLEVKAEGYFNIFTFIQSGDIIYPLDSLKGQNSRIVVDYPTEVVSINLEYFLNFATMQPKYMEWLSEKIRQNLKNSFYEITKSKNGPMLFENLMHVQKILDREAKGTKDNVYQLFTKTKLATYCQISRSTFNNELKILKESSKFDKDTFLEEDSV